MKRMLLFLVCAVLFQFYAFAQAPLPISENQKCPTVSVSLSPSGFGFGETTEAAIDIDETNYKLKFKWYIAGGEIVEGQGTKKIKARKTSEAAGRDFVATVEIEGLPENCVRTASASAQTDWDSSHYVLIDEYGRITIEDEKPRLNEVTKRIQEYKELKSLFLIYAKPQMSQVQIDKRIKRIFSYLVKTRKLEPSRLLFAVSEANKEQTQVYLYVRPKDISYIVPKKHELIKGEDLAKKFAPPKSRPKM